MILCWWWQDQIGRIICIDPKHLHGGILNVLAIATLYGIETVAFSTTEQIFIMDLSTLDADTRKTLLKALTDASTSLD